MAMSFLRVLGLVVLLGVSPTAPDVLWQFESGG